MKANKIQSNRKQYLSIILLVALGIGLTANGTRAASLMDRPLGGAPFADYGDVPDGTPTCSTGPTFFPTLFNSANAAPGRDAPYHTILNDSWIGGILDMPDAEVNAEQHFCDWVTPPQDDSGLVTLCLAPGCVSGWSGTFAGGGVFGPIPPLVTNGWFVFPVTIGPGMPPSPDVPRYANVAVDWNKSARWGDAGLEWPLANTVVTAGPGGSQTLATN